MVIPTGKAIASMQMGCLAARSLEKHPWYYLYRSIFFMMIRTFLCDDPCLFWDDPGAYHPSNDDDSGIPEF